MDGFPHSIAKDSHFTDVSIHFFKMIFCPASWFILKKLDNSPSLSMSDSQTRLISGCASLTICAWTTRDLERDVCRTEISILSVHQV